MNYTGLVMILVLCPEATQFITVYVGATTGHVKKKDKSMPDNTLRQRLGDELIGKDDRDYSQDSTDTETKKFLVAVSGACNEVREEQRKALQATLANIEADLKGLVPKPENFGNGFDNLVRIEDVLAAIERYCMLY